MLQAKSIKLLHILLEETCKRSREIIEFVCMNLRKDLVAEFIKKVFDTYKFVCKVSNCIVHSRCIISSHRTTVMIHKFMTYPVLQVS